MAIDWKLFFDGIQAFSYLAFALFGAWWTYRLYRINRQGASEWIGKFLDAIYISSRFKDIHNALYYDYESSCRELLASRLDGEKYRLSDSDKELLNELDAFLNTLEVAVYLEQRGLIQESDRTLLFDFWFKYIARDDRKELRSYIEKFGYDRIESVLPQKVAL